MHLLLPRLLVLALVLALALAPAQAQGQGHVIAVRTSGKIFDLYMIDLVMKC